MVNRQRAPQTPPLPSLKLPYVAQQQLAGDIPLFVIKKPESPIIILEIIFPAGDWYAKQATLPILTAQMLTRGTRKHNSKALAYKIEYHGAHLDFYTGRDDLSMQCTSPAAHIEKLLPYITEIILEPTFPEEELRKLKAIGTQKIKQIEANPQKLGLERLREITFGAQHPYGQKMTIDQLNQVTTQNLKTYYQSYRQKPCYICISGPVTDTMIDALDKMTTKIEQPPCPTINHPLQARPCKEHIPKPENVQTTIILGHHTITRSHPDYNALYVTNKLLGGFFGSRLMRNIREERGYTYSIYATINPLKHYGHWYISTSVKPEHAEATKREIEKEIHNLREQPVQAQELSMLKNYLLGELLENFDDERHIASLLSETLLHGLDLSYFQKLYETIQTINPATIQTIAQKYLDPTKQSTVTIGK